MLPIPTFNHTAVLLLWIYVLYNKNKWILMLISVCYVAEVISVISILTISFMNFQGAAISRVPSHVV